jgi:hypothetical protein
MMKLFRKVRKKLVNKGKTGKYLTYALGEIVLVVIGILIALQVNEWNNERNKNKAEAAILIQLQNDLKKSEEELETIKEFYFERTKASAHVSRAFWTDDVSLDSVAKDIMIPRSSRIYSPILGTARSLISSGKIDLIRSAELKIAIIAYVEKVEYLLRDVDRYEQTYYRQGIAEIRSALPNTFESVDQLNQRMAVPARTEMMKYLFENDLNPVPAHVEKVPFQSDLNQLLQDERIYRGYSSLYISHRNILRIYTEISEITVELSDQIQQPLTGM